MIIGMNFKELGIPDDVEFGKQLLAKENLAVLPGFVCSLITKHKEALEALDRFAAQSVKTNI